MDNEIIFDPFDSEHLFFSLQWIMQAKIYVKTPILSYIRRDSPYSQTNMSFSEEKLARVIENKIKMPDFMDNFLNKLEFFKNNEAAKYVAKCGVIKGRDWHDIERRAIYKNGVTPEVYNIVKKVFQRNFGKDYFYPMLLFHWAHVAAFNQKVSPINFVNQENNLIKSDIKK